MNEDSVADVSIGAQYKSTGRPAELNCDQYQASRGEIGLNSTNVVWIDNLSLRYNLSYSSEGEDWILS